MDYTNYSTELDKIYYHVDDETEFSKEKFNKFNLVQNKEDLFNDYNKSFNVYEDIRNKCKIKCEITGKDTTDYHKFSKMCRMVASDEYRIKKVYFEKYHCKVLGVNGIIRIQQKKDDEKIEIFTYRNIKDNYSNLYVNMYVRDGVEEIEFIKLWLKDKSIRQYNSIDFIPPSKQITINNFMYLVGDDCGRHTPYCYNTYDGYRIEKIIGDKNYSIDEIKEIQTLTKENNEILGHIFNLMGRNEECYEYYLDWLAHLTQFREKLPEVACVLISKQGAGKGTIQKLFSKMIGKKYVRSTADIENVFGIHSNTFKDRFFVVFEEVRGTDTFKYSERIKSIITDKQQVINQKYRNIEDYDHFCRLQFHSNNINGVVKIGNSDRRFFIVECSDEHIGNVEYFNKLHSMIDDEEEVKKIFLYLLLRDLSKRKSFKNRPITNIYRTIKRSSIHNTIKFLLDLLLNQNMLSLEEKCGKIEIKFKHLYARYLKFCERTKLPSSNINVFGIRMESYDGMDIVKTKIGNKWNIDIKKIKEVINSIYDEDMFVFAEEEKLFNIEYDNLGSDSEED